MAVAPDDGERLVVAGDLDRQALEAFLLEARRLAKRYRVEIQEVRIEPATDAPG